MSPIKRCLDWMKTVEVVFANRGVIETGCSVVTFVGHEQGFKFNLKTMLFFSHGIYILNHPLSSVVILLAYSRVFSVRTPLKFTLRYRLTLWSWGILYRLVILKKTGHYIAFWPQESNGKGQYHACSYPINTRITRLNSRGHRGHVPELYLVVSQAAYVFKYRRVTGQENICTPCIDRASRNYVPQQITQ